LLGLAGGRHKDLFFEGPGAVDLAASEGVSEHLWDMGHGRGLTSVAPLLSNSQLLHDSCKRMGSIASSYEGPVGVGSHVGDGLGDWQPQKMNSPVACVPSMRLPICSKRGKPLFWKGFALGCC
jgi:hypothetical protein